MPTSAYVALPSKYHGLLIPGDAADHMPTHNPPFRPRSLTNTRHNTRLLQALRLLRQLDGRGSACHMLQRSAPLGGPRRDPTRNRGGITSPRSNVEHYTFNPTSPNFHFSRNLP